MVRDDFSNLKRALHPMADFVKEALEERGLMNAYRSRPPYQQNDYLGWINRAKREATKQKRLRLMLNELEDDNLYMKMEYRPQS